MTVNEIISSFSNTCSCRLKQHFFETEITHSSIKKCANIHHNKLKHIHHMEQSEAHEDENAGLIVTLSWVNKS